MNIERLVWDFWNRVHIAKHGCTLEEVEFICFGNHVFIRESYKNRSVIAGPSPSGRIITIIIGTVPNAEPGTWYPFSARPADNKEQKVYEQKSRS